MIPKTGIQTYKPTNKKTSPSPPKTTPIKTPLQKTRKKTGMTTTIENTRRKNTANEALHTAMTPKSASITVRMKNPVRNSRKKKG